MKGDASDPRGLIAESYNIEGITEGECRSIFLDWALGAEGDSRAAVGDLLARYAGAYPEHPMTQVLRDGLKAPDRPRRRGGWRARER